MTISIPAFYPDTSMPLHELMLTCNKTLFQGEDKYNQENIQAEAIILEHCDIEWRFQDKQLYVMEYGSISFLRYIIEIYRTTQYHLLAATNFPFTLDLYSDVQEVMWAVQACVTEYMSPEETYRIILFACALQVTIRIGNPGDADNAHKMMLNMRGPNGSRSRDWMSYLILDELAVLVLVEDLIYV